MTPTQIDAHALGVSLAESPEDAMSRLLSLDKARLVERHAAEVSALQSDIQGWEKHAAEVGDEIRKRNRRIDRLMLAVAGLAMVVGYLLMRDARCGAAWWGD